MKTKAVRLYGKMDLRLEEFELPEIKEDEILVKVIADSLCMSTYKAAVLGPDHKRVPDDVALNPIIVGHEMVTEIVEIGKRWKDAYVVGERFALQPALNYKGSMDSPGYSYQYCGGDATYMILPFEVMYLECLLPYKGRGLYKAALSEPYSCVIGACRSLYRTDKNSHNHFMGIQEDGRMAIIGGCGPMGLAALDYAISGEFRPRQLIVTDIDNKRLARASKLFAKKAEERGISLICMNTAEVENPSQVLRNLTDNEGFSDILVMVASAQVLEFSEKLLAFNGCMNFFAGPTDTEFSAKLNYYDVHYAEKHIIGTTGGNAADMAEALDLMEKDLVNPEALITHIGGLDAVAEATMHLPELSGGKKLIYTSISLPLIDIDDLSHKANESSFYAGLATLVDKHGGVWNEEAEQFLLTHGKAI
ncbi:MAG: L-sorbose 1-phosphate reductase [Spirochaetia bacterium]|nr:L-sorbose 1-phosphate reductase [Spirochaetia bacterium]